jgi:subtilisin carlsberg
MNNNKHAINSEAELILAHEKELKVIKNDTGTKKYPIILEYSNVENKQNVLQILSELKCPIIKSLDFARCIVTNLTKSEIEEIKKHDFIKTIERNYNYDLQENQCESKNDNQSKNYNITQKSIDMLKAQNKTRGKVKVAIFDTGVAKHPDLNIAGGVCFVGNGKTYTDTDGHGTKMAGIIASAENKESDSKFIDLYAVKIFDENGYTTTASIICAINWAIENKIDIINMSFGTYYPSKILKKYIDKATEYGIVIVAAVGNDGGFKNRYRIMYPAKYDNVIAVGSGDENGVSIFSNNSIDLDFVAPGTAMSIDINGGHANITGTSVSCAYITSVLASIWSINRNISSTELISLAKSSGKVQNANDSYVGYGEIDAGIALTNISTSDKIETSKSNIYSVEMITAVSDTSYSTAAPKVASYSSYSNCGSTDCICDDFMPSAIQLSLSTLTEISYSQLKQGVWYKFTADELDAHPGVGTGFYYIYTLGQSDTIGELYDSNGNFIASNEGDSTNSWRGFEIYAELEYAKTYYVYVEEKNLVGGSVAIGVNPIEDDYGNCISNATYLGDVYSQNISVSGFLHNAIDYYQNGDLDYFYFRSTKDCVAEIYSEGSSEVYGAIFDANGVAVELNSFDIVNDDFKLTCRIECGKLYYIEISKLSNFDYATHYTLNVKFLKDYCIIPDDFYITNSIVTWYNNSYILFPTFPDSVSINHRAFMSKESARIWRDCYLDDPDFAQTLLSITSDTLKNYNDIMNTFSSLSVQANIPTVLIASIILSILEALIPPIVDAIIFRTTLKNMDNNNFMIAEFFTVGEYDLQGNYDSYDSQSYNISSGNYLYGSEYLYGTWERIILLKEPE